MFGGQYVEQSFILKIFVSHGRVARRCGTDSERLDDFGRCVAIHLFPTTDTEVSIVVDQIFAFVFLPLG